MKFFRPSKSTKRPKVYIIPNRQGLLLVGMIVITVLIGAALQNNLIYLHGFALFSIFFVTMIQTNQNLNGLKIGMVTAEDGFAHDSIWVCVQLVNETSAARQSLFIEANNKKYRTTHRQKIEQVPAHSSQRVVFPIQGLSRGRHVIPDIRVSTTFPLGILYSWFVYRPKKQVFVYPQPAGDRAFSCRYYDVSEEGTANVFGGQGIDFKEYQQLQAGDSPARIDWKLYARSDKLFTKINESEANLAASFSLEDLKGINTEEKLSQISMWCLNAWSNKWPFELRLPSGTVPLGTGQAHYQACQRSLAIYRETNKE